MAALKRASVGSMQAVLRVPAGGQAVTQAMLYAQIK
jgi:hypothetical protein